MGIEQDNLKWIKWMTLAIGISNTSQHKRGEKPTE